MRREATAARGVEIDELARRVLPGMGGVRRAQCATGPCHDTYRCWRDGREFALRVPRAAAPRSRVQRAWERRTLEAAARAGLAPPLVYADEAGGVLALAWIEGAAWTAERARSADGLAAVADLARRIHDLPVPRPARVVTPAQWVQRYRRALARAAARAPLGPDIAEADVQARLAAWARLTPRRDALCHGDLHVGNLLTEARRLWVIDWEYAHVSHPFWDLAGWITNVDLDPWQARTLLAAYLGREPRADERDALDTAAWLFDYVSLLWSALVLAGGAGPAAADLAAQARLRAARLASGAPVVA